LMQSCLDDWRPALPNLDRLEGMNQHDDVERQIVANMQRQYQLEQEHDRAGTVAVDDPVGILDQFPTAFQQHGKDQAALPGEAREGEEGRAVEQDAVQDMGQRVPV